MQEKLIYLEREKSKYSATGHKIKSWYYALLIYLYKRKENQMKSSEIIVMICILSGIFLILLGLLLEIIKIYPI